MGLGEYGFWFAVCQFMALIANGLAIRQMVLTSASLGIRKQAAYLVSTIKLVFLLQLVQAVLLVSVTYIRFGEVSSLAFTGSLIAYTASLNFSELFRQFFYMRSRQRASLVYTALSSSVGTIVFFLVLYSEVASNPTLLAFLFLSLAQFTYCICVLCHSKRLIVNSENNAMDSIAEWGIFLNRGLRSTLGMVVTWFQNQSVTPMLMFMAGPVTVGVYQLARMFITPINMITTGLSKSALSQMRKEYGKGGDQALQDAVTNHQRTSLRVVGFYTLLILSGWVLNEWIQFIQVVDGLPAFAFVVVVQMVLSNYRFWISQPFVIRMQFNLLLKIAVSVAIFTMIMMLVAGLLLENSVLIASAPVFGEILLISIYGRVRNKSVSDA